MTILKRAFTIEQTSELPAVLAHIQLLAVRVLWFLLPVPGVLWRMGRLEGATAVRHNLRLR